ncbi:hypothetical protein PG985_016455 [Apiospora marii]|uniref:uncharacterized protein n=1 Tax=Apiospora marii TaxID=335849 RepID=UPI00312ED9FB
MPDPTLKHARAALLVPPPALEAASVFTSLPQPTLLYTNMPDTVPNLKLAQAPGLDLTSVRQGTSGQASKCNKHEHGEGSPRSRPPTHTEFHHRSRYYTAWLTWPSERRSFLGDSPRSAWNFPMLLSWRWAEQRRSRKPSAFESR